MSRLADDYEAYTLDSPRDRLAVKLDYIATEPAYKWDNETRRRLIELILEDLAAIADGTPKRLQKTDAALALLAVKALGKVPQGAEVIGRPQNLKTLLSVSAVLSSEHPHAWCEAFRCIANTLLQNDEARITWTSAEVGGGDATAALIDETSDPDRVFLLCRTLFLSSLSSAGPEGAYVKLLVEEKNIINILAARLDELAAAMITGAKMSREATSETLKFAFNILHIYPKIAPAEEIASPDASAASNDDPWDPRLDAILPPLLRLLVSMSPTSPSPLNPPMTHVIHALIAVPATPALLPLWFETPSPNSASADSPSSVSASGSASALGTGTAPVSASGSGGPGSATEADKDKDSKDGKGKEKHKLSRFDRALSALSFSGGREKTHGHNSRTRTPPPPDPFQHLMRLLDLTLAFYVPGAMDPDDEAIRARSSQTTPLSIPTSASASLGTSLPNPNALPPTYTSASSPLDDALSAISCVLARLCKYDARARTRVGAWLWPADLDRSVAAGGLETRADALGRCLRLLGSVYHSRAKEGMGEMLFAAADSDASILASQVGYGNVAGLLYAKGILSAPGAPPSRARASTDSPSSSSAAGTESADGPAINPITGVAYRENPSGIPEMTDEEKEHEAEKLFVLFDRLERTGAIKPEQNPVREAMRKANS